MALIQCPDCGKEISDKAVYSHILSFSKIFLSRCCPLPGPAGYKSMRPYIDITESAKKDAIKKMEDAFKKK